MYSKDQWGKHKDQGIKVGAATEAAGNQEAAPFSRSGDARTMWISQGERLLKCANPFRATHSCIYTVQEESFEVKIGANTNV